MQSLEYYYQKSKESGIASMSCAINACIHNPRTGEHKCWPEVKNYYQYIAKCYEIAGQIPIDELKKKFYEARGKSKNAMKEVYDQVTEARKTLDRKDLNHGMGYTPISHMREQLRELQNQIFEAMENYIPVASGHQVEKPRRRSPIAKFSAEHKIKKEISFSL